MKKKNFYITCVTVILSTAVTLTSAWADQTPNHKLDRKVAAACAKLHGFALPSDATQQLSSAQVDQIHSCHKSFRAAVHACAQKSGISKPREMTGAQVQSYRSCEQQALAEVK